MQLKEAQKLSRVNEQPRNAVISCTHRGSLFYDIMFTKHEDYIFVDDKTCIKLDFKQIPCARQSRQIVDGLSSYLQSRSRRFCDVSGFERHNIQQGM